MRSEGFYVNEKSIDTSWDRTSDLPICSTAPYPLCHRGPRAYIYIYRFQNVFLRCPTHRLHCFLSSSLKYLHLDEGIFGRVRRLAWCNDPESYAGGSVATGRATLAGQVKGEHPDREGYTDPPGWGLGRWASIPSPGKKC